MVYKKEKQVKRIGKKVYFTPNELELVKQLADRISSTAKAKPVSAIIRTCVLAVAENPDLDLLVFAPKSDNQLTIDQLLIRERLVKSLEQNIRILHEHGVDLSFLDDKGTIEDKDHD